MNWSEKIHTLRVRRSLTQKQVADAIGVSDQTISNWETGVYKPRLTFKQTKALCEVLQCTLDDLIAATEDEEE